MALNIWDVLEHFNKTEKWGNPDKMNPALLVLLDKIREKVGHPIRINCGWEESGHVNKSHHYYGDAVDFAILGVPFAEAERLLVKALQELGVDDKVGLGIYPYWNTPGFHLDVRGTKARWGRDKDGKYVSYSLALSQVRRA